MPSPIGHALAGLAIGWAAEPAPARPPDSPWKSFPVLATAVAMSPDLDLLYPGTHRMWTHSIGATALVFIVTIAVTGKVTGKIWWRLAATLVAAHLSHILLDWLGTDHLPPAGIEALWPFSKQFYLSGWDLFPPVERRFVWPDIFWTDLRALFAEVAIMGPVAGIALITKTRRARNYLRKRTTTERTV